MTVDQLPTRLRSKIVVDGVSGCWLWTAHVNSRGYGRVGMGSKVELAHRVIYEMLVGLVPAGLEIDHTCRVSSCVNPSHLELVTHAENMRRSTASTRNIADAADHVRVKLLPRPISSMYAVDDKTGCWIWTGATVPGRGGSRRGKLGRAGRTQMAHRYLYESHVGPIPEGLELGNLCRTPLCVNPEHHRPGTHSEVVSHHVPFRLPRSESPR